VLIPEIRDQNNNLSIPRYITKNIEIEVLDMAEEFKKLSNCQERFKQSQQKLTSLLAKFQ
jgi:type I restriction enzyme M protein